MPVYKELRTQYLTPTAGSTPTAGFGDQFSSLGLFVRTFYVAPLKSLILSTAAVVLKRSIDKKKAEGFRTKQMLIISFKRQILFKISIGKKCQFSVKLDRGKRSCGLFKESRKSILALARSFASSSDADVGLELLEVRGSAVGCVRTFSSSSDS